MRHAWLIIAHNEFGILQQLISLLDDADSAFYVHIDKKVCQLPELHVSKGRLHVLQNRIDVRWGSVSQIKCELSLLEAAAANGPYDFYHIISGTTLPLQSFDQIDDFFSRHAGQNIVTGLCKDNPYQETLKIHRYNLFLRHYAYGATWQKKASQFCWKSAIAVQRALRIERNKGKDFFKSSNWLSLSKEATRYLIFRKKSILKTYHFSFCGDEYFVPSELMNSPLKKTVINCDKYLMYTIKRANAEVFLRSQWADLCKSEYLFARKFTGYPQIDPDS